MTLVQSGRIYPLRLCITVILVSAATTAGNIGVGAQTGMVRTYSAKTLGKTAMKVGGSVHYAQSGDFMRWEYHPQYALPLSETAKLLSTNLHLAFGLTSFWDIAASMPFYWDASENGPRSEFGLGDLEITTKLLYPPPRERRVFYQSYLLGVAAGITDLNNRGIYPRHTYYHLRSEEEYRAGDIFTSDGFVGKAMMVWTFDLHPAVSWLPLEATINGGGALPNSRKAIAGLLNGSIIYSPSAVFSLFVDYSSELRTSRVLADPLDILTERMMVTPGIRIRSPAGISITLAADIGLTEDSPRTRTVWNRDGGRYTTAAVPSLGAQFSFGWDGFLSAQDRDNDGIKDSDDRCPDEPEDIDGFEDNDGCPDPDNDRDGIPDISDRCPNDPEDYDGFQDEDGCPDPDNDGDGIPDTLDQCPNAAEDFDGFQDQDGCPDPDNDNDGIPDSQDRCPNDPEDYDRFEDDDGCPDIDNDKDGIPDLRDRCPDEPETFNGFEDDDGCPDEIPAQSRMPRHQILEGVVFSGSDTDLVPASYHRLSELVQELKKFSTIEIEIRAHTDASGSSAANMQLSQLRAETVRQYLIAQGIEASRIRAMGFGSTSPIADNRTAVGRSKNRRIEIIRLK